MLYEFHYYQSKKALSPFVRGFSGDILPISPNNRNPNRSFITNGRIARLTRSSVEISELPYGEWTENYKALLCGMAEKGLIRGFSEHHTFTRVRFVVACSEQFLDEMVQQPGGLLAGFKLTANILMNNMHAFDRTG